MEREKSQLESVQIDWHNGQDGKKVRAILDDASRNILVGDEFEHEYEEYSIELFKKLVREYWGIRRVRELIIDNGSQFGAHRRDERGDWNSEFKRVVESFGVKIIITGVNHRQTNGKLEKWNDTYDKTRGKHWLI